jgi:hypothetical protein
LTPNGNFCVVQPNTVCRTSQFAANEFQARILHLVHKKMHIYEVRPRKDKRALI